MQENLFQQGVELMIYGMGTVFVFLVVLIILTSLMSVIVQRFFPEASEAIVPGIKAPISSGGSGGSGDSDDAQIIAVITAAVHRYRSRHKP